MPPLRVDASMVILTVLAAIFAVVAYVKDPRLPLVGAREAPLMGWRFVIVRVVPSLAFPVIAGWLVLIFYSE